jgi:PilZ domain
LQTAAAKAAFIERRRSRRTRARSPIILIVDEEGRTVSRATTTFDVSASGARVGVSPKLTVGQPVKIILHEANQEFVPCRVVWVGKRPEGAREAGLEFLHDGRPLTPKGKG